MKVSRLIGLIATLVILGVGSLLFYKQTLPNVDETRKDVMNRIMTLDVMLKSINELSIKSRYNLDNNYDNLTSTSKNLEYQLKDFQNLYYSNADMTTDLTAKRFFEYKNTQEVKKEMLEKFKSHNSILRNSERYVPIVGEELMALSQQEGLEELSKSYEYVLRNILKYSLFGSINSLKQVKSELSRLPKLESDMPEFASISIIEFSNHIFTIIEQKEKTDEYLNKLLQTDDKGKLNNLISAWDLWYEKNDLSHEKLRKITFAFTIFMVIAVLIILGVLKQLYDSLDEKVALKTCEVKLAYQELRESELKLIQSEKMSSLGQMVAGIAHELNTPLGYVFGNANIIKNNLVKIEHITKQLGLFLYEVHKKPRNIVLTKKHLKFLSKKYAKLDSKVFFLETSDLLEDAIFGLNKMSDLVISLKKFSRMDRDELVKFCIHDGLDSTIKICGNDIGNRRIIKFYETEPIPIECFPAQLSQVLINVMNNAIQATKSDEGVICIRTVFDNDRLCLIIQDNGKGMDEDTQNKMFDPFFTTKDVGEGTGLGMSISYKIIKSHSGDISVESAINKGTIVKITLPLEQIELVSDEQHYVK